MEDDKPKERPRPHFWHWGDPITQRNPIREAWEAKQQARRREQLAKFLQSRKVTIPT